MTDRYPPINAKAPVMLHGGDYNPDQWPEDIWAEDMRLMKLANCNTMSVGIFAWARLEPAEGKFDFDWLDKTMDNLAENGAYAVLATPTGARPAWMSRKYPEVLRVRPDRGRNLHGKRHNHCMTSPVYREKVAIINTQLAERYRDHPALILWHLSNEYGGECHCDLCQAAFRQWLQERYGTLDALNAAWWTSFWAHTYSDWSQIESPSSIGEDVVHAQNLDWRRFVTDQTLDFMLHERDTVKAVTPDIPVTTNFMGLYYDLNYWKLAPHIDVISWDSYPQWHQTGSDYDLASDIAFVHDINRSLHGGQPWMLMESVPSTTNWFPRGKRKRPGVHILTSMQAVAHGSDTVQYFQWRKSRGSSEKLHGAVVDHVGHENTRVFREVAQLGEMLGKLDDVVGTTVRPEVAIIFDQENRWAMDDAQGPIRGDKGYVQTAQNHYRAFWQMGIPVDVIDMEQPLDSYKLVVAPMLYMVREGVGKRISQFVKDGGTFVTSYMSGWVNQTDLCFLGGFPGPLREVLGIWDEETDALPVGDTNQIAPLADNALGLTAAYPVQDLCALIHAETATVLATFSDEWYAGRPALTVNKYGNGHAYYIAGRSDATSLHDFYSKLSPQIELERVLDTDVPQGVSVTKRTDGQHDYLFLMNFTPDPQTVPLDSRAYTNALSGDAVSVAVTLAGYGVAVVKRYRGNEVIGSMSR